MGRRKKSELPPIKMVIGRSPEQKTGHQNDNYTVLDQTAGDDSATMRSKRRASNIDPKKWKEDDSDDDLEVLEVYKPPTSHKPSPTNTPTTRPRGRPPKHHGKFTSPGNQTTPRRASDVYVPPRGNISQFTPRRSSTHQHQIFLSAQSLLMECVEEELSAAQKNVVVIQQTEYDNAKQKIKKIKVSSQSCTEEIMSEYVGPESTTVKQLPGAPAPAPAPAPVSVSPPKNHQRQRSASPDVMIIDGPSNVRGKRKTLQLQTPTSQPPPLASKPPVITRPPPQDIVLMGPNGQPIIIPGHLMPPDNQPIVLQTGATGQLQIVGGGIRILGQQTLPVVVTKITPPMAPSMRFPPPPPLQNMARGGTKRPADSNVQPPNPKRTRNRRKQNPQAILPSDPSEENELVNYVPLDEYYYSKKEGDPAYREEKAEYRFKCFYCFKMLYNNLRIMMHIQGHIDSDKQQNLDLSDLTQCKHCYKQFDTPFEMQCHVEKIHQNRSNVLVCRICEKDHVSQGDLKVHMKIHNACEMPYICQLCNFRSSVYNDVVDHFKKRHDSSRYLVCLYCLKVFEIKFAKNQGWGLTQNYYQHLIKHQTKSTKIKCSWCKLVFNNKAELQMHKTKDHMPNYRGTQAVSSSITVNTSSEQVMIRVPDSSKSKTLKSLNAPASQRLLLVGFCDFYGLTPQDNCLECRKPMLTADHYKKYMECSMCRFATTCNEAYAHHMKDFHSRKLKKQHSKLKPKTLEKPLFCLCGYSSSSGNGIANHLISCSKRTCYSQKPEAKWFEYDDEQEEFNPYEPYIEEDGEDEGSPIKDIPSLFGALGLVKKAPSRSYGSHSSSKESSPLREPSSQQIADEVIADIVDNMFPAEASSGAFIQTLMKNVMHDIGELENRKFYSLAALEKRRRASNVSSVNTDATSEQQDHKSESPEKSSVFDDEQGDQDVLSVGDSDYQPAPDENSIDSDIRSTSDNQANSNMDWTGDSNDLFSKTEENTNETEQTMNDNTKPEIDEDSNVADADQMETEDRETINGMDNIDMETQPTINESDSEKQSPLEPQVTSDIHDEPDITEQTAVEPEISELQACNVPENVVDNALTETPQEPEEPMDTEEIAMQEPIIHEESTDEPVEPKSNEIHPETKPTEPAEAENDVANEHEETYNVEQETEPNVEQETEPSVEQETQPSVEQETQPSVEHDTEPSVQQETEQETSVLKEPDQEPNVEEKPSVEHVTEPSVQQETEQEPSVEEKPSVEKETNVEEEPEQESTAEREPSSEQKSDESTSEKTDTSEIHEDNKEQTEKTYSTEESTEKHSGHGQSETQVGQDNAGNIGSSEGSNKDSKPVSQGSEEADIPLPPPTEQSPAALAHIPIPQATTPTPPKPTPSPGRSHERGGYSRDNHDRKDDRRDDRRDYHSHGYDHNRDRHGGYQDRNYHGNRDYNRSYDHRDRQDRYDDRRDRHGGNKDYYGNQRGGYHHGDRRDNRGGRGGYYGNRGGYY